MAGSYLDAEDLNIGHIDKKTFFSSHDRAILEAAAERVAKVWLRIDGIDCDDLEELKKAILAPISKEES